MLHHVRFAALFGLVLSSLAHGDPRPWNRNWIALQVDDQIVTAQEIRSHIDAVILSSDLHRVLFEDAGKNYSAYLAKKDELVEQLFSETLDRIAVVRLVQQEAILRRGRVYFGITKEQMRAALDRQIRAALAPYSGKGVSTSEAREALALNLRDSGMPWDDTMSSDRNLESWSRRLATRLREEYRQDETSRFLCSAGDCEHQTPIEILRTLRTRIAARHFLVLRPTADTELRQQAAFDRVMATSAAPFLGSHSPPPADAPSGFFYLGRVLKDRVEFLHFNDWNLAGPIGTALGYPKTDDFGRTSGFVLTYTRTGEKGSLTVQLENWLFSQRLPSVGGVQHQNVEEEYSLRLASRHFLDDEGNKWVLVGIAGTSRTQRAGLGAWIQENFHRTMGAGSFRVNEPRDGGENFVQGLFGVGGNYSILETPHVDVTISGEGLLSPAMGVLSQSSVSVKPSIDVDFYGSSKELPFLRIGLFSDLRLRSNGRFENSIGGKATVAFLLRRYQLEAGLFIVRWNGELDRRYEGGASWTSGIMLSITGRSERAPSEYEF
jgi:hypothetical protein